MKLRHVLLFVLALLAGFAGVVYWMMRPPPSLTLASLGGDYAHAQQIALFRPYTTATGVQIHEAVYGGDASEIAASGANNPPDWDVVDASLAEAAKACMQGELEELDGINLPAGADGSQPKEDFVPGALGKCWVGSLVYGHIVAYARERFAKPPTAIADFFDLARFPGGRGLRISDAEDNLLLALLGDGVAPGEVYASLATAEGANRAFAKLTSIRSSIVWYRRSSEPAEMLSDGRAAMSAALNAPIFTAITEDKRNLGILWDGQRYEIEVFGILKGAAHKSAAMDFIRYATGTLPLAEEAARLPYGPARRSAISLVPKNPDTGAEMAPYLPTAPQNFGKALAVNPQWWTEHGAALQTRWDAWVKN